MKKPTGILFYQGPSMLDASRNIAVIATLSTKNAKTGNMVQVWIIDAEASPLEVSKRKLDAAICGACPHKHSVGGACYVNLGQAPTAIYKAFRAGKYAADDSATPALLAGRKIRLGAYGDPAAMPFEVALRIVSMGSGHTAYTHQIRHPRFDVRFLELCMVSADTAKQAAVAHAVHGARTFRITTDVSDLLPGEIECLSDAKGMTCEECGICAGKAAPVSIVIAVHGARKGNFLNNRIPTLSI